MINEQKRSLGVWKWVELECKREQQTKSDKSEWKKKLCLSLEAQIKIDIYIAFDVF